MGSQSGLKLNDKLFKNTVGKLCICPGEEEAYTKKAKKAYNTIKEGKSPLLYDGPNLMTGWINLPYDYLNNKMSFINEIKECASSFSKDIDIFLSAGIGGSYLGLEAALTALLPCNYNLLEKSPKIFFIGNHMSPDEIGFILKIIKGKKIGINVISKSGTTIETAISFRLIRNIIEKNGGKKQGNCYHKQPKRRSLRAYERGRL